MNEPGKPRGFELGHDKDPEGVPSRMRSLFDRYTDDHLASREIPNMGPGKIINTPEGSVIGDLDDVLEHWDGQQSYHDTCAIRCQEYILECFTGQEIDEHELVREAFNRGWYTPGGGTPVSQVGKLLELHGIEVTRYEHSNIFHLADELAKGHKVMVALDSNELWCRDSKGAWLFEQVKDYFGFAGANHAVIVTGIDTTDPGNPQVIITDPGTGEPFARYPIEQFVEAWRDSDFTMVATAEPAPPNLPEMASFDVFRSMLFQSAGFPFLGYLWDLWNEFEPEVVFPYSDPTAGPELSTFAAGISDIAHDDHDIGMGPSDPNLSIDRHEAHYRWGSADNDADHGDDSEFD